MKVDWRKKRTVYRGIEYAMLMGDEPMDSLTTILQKYHNRTLDSQTFDKFYSLGIDAKYQDID